MVREAAVLLSPPVWRSSGSSLIIAFS